jgi:hypothetical protein
MYSFHRHPLVHNLHHLCLYQRTIIPKGTRILLEIIMMSDEMKGKEDKK